MSYIYRCSSCRTRNTWPRALASYVRWRRCRHCGHDRFYVDRERVNRLPCHCDGYHHAHRPGSRRCESNTMHPYWRSLDPDVLARLLIEFGGKPCTGAEPPF